MDGTPLLLLRDDSQSVAVLHKLLWHLTIPQQAAFGHILAKQVNSVKLFSSTDHSF